MKETGILMSAPMVLATLEDRKNQTRRTRGLDEFNEHPGNWQLFQNHDGRFIAKWIGALRSENEHTREREIKCPYGEPGDRLWVRETWGIHKPGTLTPCKMQLIQYLSWADSANESLREGYDLLHKATAKVDPDFPIHWRPSIHMPRWASRIKLEIVSVKVERVRSTSREDANAEGIPYLVQSGWNGKYEGINIIQSHHWPEENFVRLFYSINKLPSQLSPNPWVWAIAYRRVEQ